MDASRIQRMAAKQSQTQKLTIRLEQETIAALDGIVEKLQAKAMPGFTLTRTDALGSAILRGIEVFEAESKPTRRRG